MSSTPVTPGAALMIEDVRDIIALARASRSATAAVYQKHGLTGAIEYGDENFMTAMREATTRPERKALYERARKLNEQEIAELMALMWLGRGAGGEEASDWPDLVISALGMSDPGNVPYVCGKKPLPEYLEKGLRALGH